MKKKLLSIIVSMMMILNLVIPTISYAAEDNSPEAPIGHIVFDVEKATLGLGYVQEPIIVPFYEGQTGAQILISVLGEENIKYTGNGVSSFYLSKIKDNDDTELDGFATGRKQEGWLGEFDYSNMSGWMFCVNGVFPNVGMNGYKPKDNDVMRIQFTANGYGADLGSSMGGSSSVTVANKDALITAVANINSKNKDVLEYAGVRNAYKKANDVITTIGSTQTEVDEALANLNKAVANVATDTLAKPVTAITLDKTEAELFRGNKLQLTATVTPSDTTDYDKDVVWKTSNSEIAKVNETGLVTARGAGECKIYAYAGGKRATLNLTVKKDTTKIFEIEDGLLVRYNGEGGDVVIPEGVTAIGEDVFKGVSLTSINIPDTVTEIGDYAFYNCTALKSIDLPAGLKTIGNYSFYNCKGLTSLTMPEGLVSIGNYAFSNCTYVTTLNLNENLESIGDYAFEKLRMTSIELPSKLKTIGSYAFNSCTYLTSAIEFKEGMTEIPEGVFKGCSKIPSISLPSTVTSIGDYAFYGCSSATSINIPEGVKAIGNYALYNCAKLPTLSLPSGLTSIGENAFYGLKLITEVTIPEGIVALSNKVFYNCSALTNVNISSNLTEIDDYAFYNCTKLSSIKIAGKTYEENEKIFDLSNITSIGASAFYGNSLVEKINLSENLTAINEKTFYNCKALTAIDIPTGVKKIGTGAFYNCIGISNISLPDSVEAIESQAFYGMTGLSSLKLSASLKSIGSNAFYNASLLKSIAIPKSVESIDSTMVSGCKGLTEIIVDAENTSYKSVDGILYTNSGELVIYPEGKVATELQIPEGTTKLTKTLNNKSTLTKVIIPASVNEIDKNVFEGCTSLETIEVAPENESFKSVEGVLYTKSGDTLLIYPAGKKDTEYTVLDGCTSLQDNSFKGNTAITALNIPASLEVVNSAAISYANNLTTVNMSDKITKIADNAFKSCSKLNKITYPDTIESIGEYAFNATKITEINIPASAKSIGRNAFAGCSSAVGEVVIPEGITEINPYVFSGCSKLTSIKVPEGVTSIGDSSFYNCSSVTSINIPSTVKTIDTYGYANCSSLAGELVIPEGVTSIGTRAFSNCSKLTSIKVSEGITELSGNIFYNCKALESVTLPSTLKVLGDSAFYSCQVLQDVVLPLGLETIEGSAFYNCKKLEKISIPESVKNIGASAFSGCTVLNDVRVYSSDAEIGVRVFYKNSADLTIYGHKDSTMEAYAKENSLKFVPFTDLATVKFTVDEQIIAEQEIMKGEAIGVAPQAPAKEGYEFVGWFKDVDDITTKFVEGAEIQENTTYVAKYAHVEMLGAQAKNILNGKSGIRFGTKVYTDGDEIVEKGTLILPYNLLQDGEALNLDTPNVAKSVANALYEVNKSEGYETYLGSLVNIPETQFDREITATAYVIYKDKAGHEYVVYSAYKNISTTINKLLQ